MRRTQYDRKNPWRHRLPLFHQRGSSVAYSWWHYIWPPLSSSTWKCRHWSWSYTATSWTCDI